MNAVGQCLLFYLKYPLEMNRLYESPDPDWKRAGVDQNVARKLQAVGDAATDEAVALLESCAAGFERTIGKLRTVERVRSRIRESWKISYRVLPQRPRESEYEIGWGIYVEHRAIIPWIWGRGARRFEDAACRLLPTALRSADCGFQSGTIGLAKVGFSDSVPFGESVSATPLTTAVENVFSSLSSDHLTALAIMDVARSRSDE